MKQLKRISPKRSGRSKGKITVRRQGGRHKRFLRLIDWKRDKRGIEAVVESVEYDPGRSADVASLLYEDGQRSYILAPEGLSSGDRVSAGPNALLSVGNALPLGKIPIGESVHNLEIKPGKGAQVVRSAGSVATIQGREEGWVLIKMPSGEIHRFSPESYATLGQVGNAGAKSKILGKAGRVRRLGKRPSVRGVAMHPGAHPHGGGEGRSGVGLKYPKTVYGKPAVGKTRRPKKYSDKLIIEPRRPGKHA